MKKSNYDYDNIAENIFFPIYEVIAEDILEKTHIREGAILDIGCGGGHLGLTILQKTECLGTFIDINEEAIAIAKERSSEWGLEKRSTFLIEDVHQLPFPDNSFQLIISRGSMGFWKNQKKAFEEIYRVLAPGGCTYIGSGLGNEETKKKIVAEMKKVEPDWPMNLKKKLISLTTEGYRELFTELNFNYLIQESEHRGRWFLIRK